MTYNNFGIIATESGVPVQGSPDYRRVLDSNWPTMEIASEQTFSSVSVPIVAFSGFSQIIFHHGLGFAPAFTYIDVSGYRVDNSYQTNDGAGDQFHIVADSQDFYIKGSASVTGTFTFSGLLRVYNYDPTVTFQAPFYQPSDPKSEQGSYGIAALVNQYDGQIGGKDFQKFSVNTRAKELTIHMSGRVTAGGGSPQILINHNLGYLPSFMLFKNGTGTLTDNTAVRSHGTQNNLQFDGVQSLLFGDFSYIVFKDPVMQQQV